MVGETIMGVFIVTKINIVKQVSEKLIKKTSQAASDGRYQTVFVSIAAC